MPEAHDIRNHVIRMMLFDETLRSGVLYPRWLGGMNYGYGAATTNYYPPLIYYAASAAHLVIRDWSRAIELMTALIAAASVPCFYKYARLLISKKAAAIASVLYLLMPYRLTDLYHRAALPELMSFLWMPMIMLFGTIAIKQRRVWAIAAAGLALGLLILSHPPVAYLFIISIAVFSMAWSLSIRAFSPVMVFASVTFLGSLISSIYLIPAKMELGFAKEFITSTFNYKDAYVMKLFSGSGFQIMVAVEIVLSALLLCFYAYGAMQPKTDGSIFIHGQKIAWITTGAVSLLMTTPIMDPVVRHLPGIELVGFPWRWLAISTIALSLLGGMAWDNRRGGLFSKSIIFLTICVFIFGIISSARASNLKHRFQQPVELVEEDFMPVDVPRVVDLPRGKTAELLLAGNVGIVEVLEWKPQHRTVRISSLDGGVLHFYTFHFPGWAADIDGRLVEIRMEQDLGTILVDVPPGDHLVQIKFGNTPIRRTAVIVSLCGLIICLILISYDVLRPRKMIAIENPVQSETTSRPERP